MEGTRNYPTRSLNQISSNTLRILENIKPQLEKISSPSSPSPNTPDRILFKDALQSKKFSSKGMGLWKGGMNKEDYGRIWVKKTFIDEKTGEKEEWLVVYTNDDDEIIRQVASEYGNTLRKRSSMEKKAEERGGKIPLQLVGLDGNAFSILGRFQSAAREEGWSKDKIKVVLDEAMSGDYNNLLVTMMKYTYDPKEEEEYEEEDTDIWDDDDELDIEEDVDDERVESSLKLATDFSVYKKYPQYKKYFLTLHSLQNPPYSYGKPLLVENGVNHLIQKFPELDEVEAGKILNIWIGEFRPYDSGEYNSYYSSKTAANVDPKNIPLAPGIKSKNITIDESGGAGTGKVTIEFTDVDKALKFYEEEVVPEGGTQTEVPKEEEGEVKGPQEQPQPQVQPQQQSPLPPQVQPKASSLSKRSWDNTTWYGVVRVFERYDGSSIKRVQLKINEADENVIMSILVSKAFFGAQEAKDEYATFIEYGRDVDDLQFYSQLSQNKVPAEGGYACTEEEWNGGFGSSPEVAKSAFIISEADTQDNEDTFSSLSKRSSENNRYFAERDSGDVLKLVNKYPNKSEAIANHPDFSGEAEAMYSNYRPISKDSDFKPWYYLVSEGGDLLIPEEYLIEDFIEIYSKHFEDGKDNEDTFSSLSKNSNEDTSFDQYGQIIQVGDRVRDELGRRGKIEKIVGNAVYVLWGDPFEEGELEGRNPVLMDSSQLTKWSTLKSTLFSFQDGITGVKVNRYGSKYDIPQGNVWETMLKYSEHINPTTFKGYSFINEKGVEIPLILKPNIKVGEMFERPDNHELVRFAGWIDKKALEGNGEPEDDYNDIEDDDDLIGIEKDYKEMEDEIVEEKGVLEVRVEADPETIEDIMDNIIDQMGEFPGEEKLEGGLGDGKGDDEFDEEQLEKGKEVEKEHTDDEDIIEEITKDHLSEDDKYYDKLEKVEKESSVKKSGNESTLGTILDIISEAVSDMSEHEGEFTLEPETSIFEELILDVENAIKEGIEEGIGKEELIKKFKERVKNSDGWTRQDVVEVIRLINKVYSMKETDPDVNNKLSFSSLNKTSDHALSPSFGNWVAGLERQLPEDKLPQYHNILAQFLPEGRHNEYDDILNFSNLLNENDKIQLENYLYDLIGKEEFSSKKLAFDDPYDTQNDFYNDRGAYDEFLVPPKNKELSIEIGDKVRVVDESTDMLGEEGVVRDKLEFNSYRVEVKGEDYKFYKNEIEKIGSKTAADISDQIPPMGNTTDESQREEIDSPQQQSPLPPKPELNNQPGDVLYDSNQNQEPPGRFQVTTDPKEKTVTVKFLDEDKSKVLDQFINQGQSSPNPQQQNLPVPGMEGFEPEKDFQDTQSGVNF